MFFLKSEKNVKYVFSNTGLRFLVRITFILVLYLIHGVQCINPDYRLVADADLWRHHCRRIFCCRSGLPRRLSCSTFVHLLYLSPCWPFFQRFSRFPQLELMLSSSSSILFHASIALSGVIYFPDINIVIFVHIIFLRAGIRPTSSICSLI